MKDVSFSLLWRLVIGGAVAIAVAMRATGLSLYWPSAAPLLMLALLAAGAAMSRERLPTARAAHMGAMVECWFLFSAIGVTGALASYVLAAHTTGYADARLAAADRVLGFNWRAAYLFVARHPWFGLLGHVAYLSIFVSPFVVLAGLIWTERAARARRFILAYALALAITLAVFPWFPARSALTFTMGSTAAYLPATGVSHIAAIEALRAGTSGPLNLLDLHGMITFPSFHAASAALYVWAAWPVRRLRWPLVAVNAAMLTATPVEGTHYLVDVLGGLVVAVVAIRASRVRIPVRLGVLLDPMPARAVLAE